MPKKKPRLKYGNPAKNRVNVDEMLKSARPAGNTDPRELSSFRMSGPGGPHDRNGVIIDPTNMVLSEGMEVCVMDTVRQGSLDGQVTYLQIHGRINRSQDRVSLGFALSTDAVAGLITELLSLSFRDSTSMLDDVTRRLTSLHQDKNVDLYWLKAAIENAITAQEEE